MKFPRAQYRRISGSGTMKKPATDRLAAHLAVRDLKAQDSLRDRVLAATHKGPRGGGSWDLLGLARETDAKVADLEAAIAALRVSGFDVDVAEGTVQRQHIAPSGAVSHLWRLKEGGWI